MTTKILIIINLLFYSTLRSQTKDMVGIYKGIYGSDLVIIDITFDLRANNTYFISQQNSFHNSPGCQSRTESQTGKWIYKKGWIYFKPDTNSTTHDISLYVNLKDENRNNKLIKKLKNQGYSFYLKPVKSDINTTRIYFHIAHDCYESYWDNYSVGKIND